MNYETNWTENSTNSKRWVKQILFFIAIIFVIWYSISTFYWQDSSLLERTKVSNNKIYTECFGATSTGTDAERYRVSTECWKSKRSLTPDDLYLTVPRGLVDEKKCVISQGEDEHVRPERGWMYGTDLACNFKEQGVYAPDYNWEMIEYTIEATGSDNLLGSFVILSFPDSVGKLPIPTRWYFGHTVLDKKWKVWDTITTWVRFAHADLSWATTGWHTHIELRRMHDGVWQSVRYVTRGKERKLDEKRMAWSAAPAFDPYNKVVNQVNAAEITKQKYYFTHYDLWDPNQNDASPCIGASWKDLCQLESSGIRTMAVTSDLRKQLHISFWDRVRLEWDPWCEWEYSVEDEMNIRYRKTPGVLRPWTPYYIKGDIASKEGWACSITKL